MGFRSRDALLDIGPPIPPPATRALHQLRRTRVDLLGRIVGFVGDKKGPRSPCLFLIWKSIYIGYMKYFDFTWWLNCSKIWVVKICVKLSRRCNCIQIYRFLHLQLSKILEIVDLTCSELCSQVSWNMQLLSNKKNHNNFKFQETCRSLKLPDGWRMAW